MHQCGAHHTDFAAKDQIGSQLSIPSAPLSPFWRPDRHADRRPRLMARARTLAALRTHFDGEGFTEVEPAALQISPGNETHLHGFATAMIGNDGVARAPVLFHAGMKCWMQQEQLQAQRSLGLGCKQSCLGRHHDRHMGPPGHTALEGQLKLLDSSHM